MSQHEFKTTIGEDLNKLSVCVLYEHGSRAFGQKKTLRPARTESVNVISVLVLLDSSLPDIFSFLKEDVLDVLEDRAWEHYDNQGDL